eukprot:TRINITY_DN10932_c0_g1_i3.p1 TRINITY_DN10932_c0_g1~~TRINITY_DN10932_c0_g1_i3.p1  ORF type:complete len:242 (+),score=64.42 TRINITY_DN10932_c0_g1_i3:73-798(+)
MCIRDRSIPKCSIVQSEYAEEKAPQPEKDTPQSLNDPAYACLGCDGTKTNKKGTKACRICNGTGRIPQNFIDRLKDIAKSELMAEINSRMEVARTQIIEEQKKPQQELARSIPEPMVYKIDPPNKDVPVYRMARISESLGDGYKTAPEAVFEKVWVVRNVGTTSWPESTEFKRNSGDPIEATVSHVGAVKPGEEIAIKVTVKAPKKPGRYASFFRLTHSQNKAFGENPWVDFIVIDPAEAK